MATSIGVIGGDITDGGGAPAVTVDVINAMWKNAQSKSQAGAENVNDAIAFAGPAPLLTVPALDTTYVPPISPIITDTNPADGEAMYATARDQMLAMIQSNFVGFIATYFPNTQYYVDALEWCYDAFTAGGSGINADVEAQLWERGRARVMADSERAEAEAMSTWADRRWPVPPGALVSQINEIRLDAGRKLAETSRDASIKSFDAEIENVRFAVGKVLDQRKVALDAAGDYIKTLMLGPQTAMQLATGLANIRSDFSRSLVSLYAAQSQALEPRVRLAIADADLKLRGAAENLRSQVSTIDAKVRAALQGAQMVASMASAGINAINAQTSISGSDSSSI